MTEEIVPDKAVQIALGALDERDVPWLEDDVRDMVAVLARAGWLHDPKRVAELEAVAEAAEKLYRYKGNLGAALIEFRAALDATTQTEAEEPT